jgi:very-short-patch-repair endonuclease
MMICIPQQDHAMRGPQAHTCERRLRRQQTDAEARLWHHLRDRRLLGYKFRRQHRIGPYFADLVCIQAKLIVELDGSQHLSQRVYDDIRTQRLQCAGYRVLRFWNDDVLLRVDDVLAAVTAALEAAPHPSLRATFAPQRGVKQ